MTSEEHFREKLGHLFTSARQAVVPLLRRLHDRWERLALRPWQKWALVFTSIVVFTVTLVVGLAWRTYSQYSEIVQSKLGDGVLQPAAQIYSEPEVIEQGKRITLEAMVALLRKCGYSEYATNEIGHFQVVKKSLRLYPGPKSMSKPNPSSSTLAQAVESAALLPFRAKNRSNCTIWNHD